MRYINLLIIILISLPGEKSYAQERIAYRVEVIVLRLVQSDFPPVSSAQLRDFSGLLNLEKETIRRDTWITNWLSLEPTAIADFEVTPPLKPEASQFMHLDGISYIPDMSEQMSSVWRNLRLSSDYRPEVYLSWQQRAEGFFPPLRVHNQEIIRIEDDYSDLRADLSSAPTQDAQDAPGFFHYDFAAGTLETGPLPEPRQYYSLDGEVRMRRSRFLHVDLDLEFRQPAPATRANLSGPPLLLKHQGYQVHPLRQSRQVRTGRLEYFDSPVLGALVWVTGIDRPEEASDQ